jgi:hypothetical protein
LNGIEEREAEIFVGITMLVEMLEQPLSMVESYFEDTTPMEILIMQ